MTDTIVPTAVRDREFRFGGAIHRLARASILRRLAKLTDGELLIREGRRQWRCGVPRPQEPRPIEIRIRHPVAWSDFAFGGPAAAGASYVKGRWQCAQLTALTRLFLRNRGVLDAGNSGAALLGKPLRRLGHWLRRNTPGGSRRNIHAHYDIGNDLFGLFLDRNLMYSSAYYPDARADLEVAAVAKLDRICRKLGLRPEHHLLEIGSGWGGLAIHAAQRYGCRVTTTTISEAQYAFTRARVAREGLAERIEVRRDDYRVLQGRYDRLVSVEMIEAVGHDFMGAYFNQCSRLLKADGYMLLQAITIDDRRYERALREVDFIKRYIFPGGFLPSVTAMANALTGATDLRLSHLEDLGLHYARTLGDWRARFMARLDEVRALGYPQEFIRLWDFYLCYSAGGFAERHLGLVQMLLSKPAARLADVTY